MTREQFVVTQKSIRLLTQCLRYQRLRFNKARMEACQAAMFLRSQTIYLEAANSALNNYPQVDYIGIQGLLQNAQAKHKAAVEHKKKVFYRCQEIALKEHRKIDCMEKTLIKLHLRQKQYSNV